MNLHTSRLNKSETKLFCWVGNRLLRISMPRLRETRLLLKLYYTDKSETKLPVDYRSGRRTTIAIEMEKRSRVSVAQ